MKCDVVLHLLHERAVTGAVPAPGLHEHLAACAGCRDAEAAIAHLPAALVEPAPPCERVRARILEGTRHGRRLPSFAGAIAELFAIPRPEAASLLAELERAEAWGPGFVPGNWIRRVRPGASLGPSAGGMLLRTRPGVTLPRHGHGGPERTFVLQGGYADSAGGEVWAGEHVRTPEGTLHELHVLPPVECVAAVLVHGGVHLAR